MSPLNNMDTFIRALNLHLAIIIHIMQCISNFLTKKMMEPGGEAGVEGGETAIEVQILVAPAPGGKDLEVTLAHTMVITEVRGAFTQGRIPWRDLMDPTGEETIGAGILNKPLKTRTPGLKNPGSLARSRGEDNKMERVLT